jgi:hypothetical protein
MKVWLLASAVPGEALLAGNCMAVTMPAGNRECSLAKVHSVLLRFELAKVLLCVQQKFFLIRLCVQLAEIFRGWLLWHEVSIKDQEFNAVETQGPQSWRRFAVACDRFKLSPTEWASGVLCLLFKNRSVGAHANNFSCTIAGAGAGSFMRRWCSASCLASQGRQ